MTLPIPKFLQVSKQPIMPFTFWFISPRNQQNSRQLINLFHRCKKRLKKIKNVKNVAKIKNVGHNLFSFLPNAWNWNYILDRENFI